MEPQPSTLKIRNALLKLNLCIPKGDPFHGDGTFALQGEIFWNVNNSVMVKAMSHWCKISLDDSQMMRLRKAWLAFKSGTRDHLSQVELPPGDENILTYLKATQGDISNTPQEIPRSRQDPAHTVLRPFVTIPAPRPSHRAVKALTPAVKRFCESVLRSGDSCGSEWDACELIALGCVAFFSDIMQRAAHAARARNLPVQKVMNLQKRLRDGPDAAEAEQTAAKVAALRKLDAQRNCRERRRQQIMYFLLDPNLNPTHGAELRRFLAEMNKERDDEQQRQQLGSLRGVTEVVIPERMLILPHEVDEALLERKRDVNAMWWDAL